MSAQVETKEQVYCYIGRKACGCYVAAAVDRPEYAKETAKNLADWVKVGMTVERHPIAFVRENVMGCDCAKKQMSLL